MKKSQIVAAVTSIALTGLLSSCSQEESGKTGQENRKETQEYRDKQYKPERVDIPVLYGPPPSEQNNNKRIR